MDDDGTNPSAPQPRKGSFSVPKHVKCLLVLVSLGFLSSCNIPTLEQDVKHGLRKARNLTQDAFERTREELEDTFDKENNDLIDPDAGLSRDDYRRTYLEPTIPTIKDNPPELVLPDVSQLLVAPRPPVVGQDKLVTISVTEEIPLKDVMIELARRADVDIEVDPGIAGGIIFRAKDKPFSEVVERIADLAGLRYSVKNGVLKVERDLPYIVNYKMDLLNLVRSNEGGVTISTNVLSAGASGGSSAVNSGSSSNLTTSYEGDVWNEITEAINSIIENYSGSVTTFQTASTADPAVSDVLGAPTRGGASATAGADASAILSVNRQSGIIAVLASQRQHTEIKSYLDQTLESQTAQVLIEAKIVEVTLDEEFRSGIQWNAISEGKFDFTANANLTGATTGLANDFVQITALPQEFLGFDDLNLEAVIDLTERFGVSRTLSSPRINAMNNQQAVLAFAENFVYFDIDVQEEDEGTGSDSVSTLTIDSEVQTVPIGVILTLHPTIDLKSSEVLMNIRPTLSRVTGTVADPGVALTASQQGINIDNLVPQVEVREIDTIMRIKSGQVMVIGGLMEERVSNEDNGVPFLQDVPYLGNAFKSVNKDTEVVETVIFIKATIIPPFGVSQEDQEFYRKFTTDRHPLTF